MHIESTKVLNAITDYVYMHTKIPLLEWFFHAIKSHVNFFSMSTFTTNLWMTAQKLRLWCDDIIVAILAQLHNTLIHFILIIVWVMSWTLHVERATRNWVDFTPRVCRKKSLRLIKKNNTWISASYITIF